MFYWLFKWLLFAPMVRVVLRPRLVGAHRLPAHGPAILACNHLSATDTFMLPAMMRRRLTFPAKLELFQATSPVGRVVSWFLTVVGQKPMDRSGGRASAGSMESVLAVLRSGELLGIFPEGTRSPDGRLYKGKTGAARLVLQARVPVIPIGFVDSRFTARSLLRRPQMIVGEPLDFSAYAVTGGDRDVLRFVTDEIMAAIQELTGQEYVDAYATSVRVALAEGRDPGVVGGGRPGEHRPVPPPPAEDAPSAASPLVAPQDVRDVSA